MSRLIPYRAVLHMVNPKNQAEMRDCGTCGGSFFSGMSPMINCEIALCGGRLADSVGGTGSHGRKRRTAGHVKAVLSRAQVTVQVCVQLAVCPHAILHDY